MKTWVCGLVALSLVACGPRIVELSADDDRVIVAVVVGVSGKVLDGRILDTNEKLQREIPGDAEIFGYSIRRSDLVTLDGQPLSSDQLAQIKIGDEAQACGRCLAPSPGPPLVLQPGSDCALPAFAEPLGRTTNAPVLMSWPGTCPCKPRSRSEARIAPPMTVRPVLPSTESWPMESVAVDPSGAVMGAGEHILVRIDATGQSTTRLGPNVFGGPILGLAPWRQGDFVGVVHDATVPGELASRFVVIHPDLSFDLGAPVDMRVNGVEVHRSGAIIIAGWRNGPAMGVCSSPTEETCRYLLGPNLHATHDRQLRRIYLGDDGSVTFAGLQGGLLWISGVEPVMELESESESAGARFGTLRGGSGTTYTFRYEINPRSLPEGDAHFPIHMGVNVGGAFLGCGSTRTGIDIFALRPDLSDPAKPFRTSVLASSLAACTSATPMADSSIAVRNGRLESWRCTLGGCVGAPSDLTPGLDGRVTARSGDWTVGSDPFSIVVRSPESGVFTSRYGRSRHRAVTSIVETSEGLWLFFEDGTVTDVESTPLTITPTISGNVSSAVFDERAGRVLVVSGGQLRSIDVATKELERLDGPTGLRNIVEVAPERFLLSDVSSKLFVLTGKEVRSVAIDWDDPLTATAETQPGLDDVIQRLAASDGGALAVGCKLTVLRVDTFSEHPRAQRVLANRANPELYGSGEQNTCLTSAWMACADVGAIGLNGRNTQDSEQGRVWNFEPESPNLVIGGNALRFSMDVANDNAFSSNQLESTDPRYLFESQGELAFVFLHGGLHRVASTSRTRLAPFQITAGMAVKEGRLFLGGTYGGVFEAQ